MYLSMALLGAAHGLIFLPVLLSYLGMLPQHMLSSTPIDVNLCGMAIVVLCVG